MDLKIEDGKVADIRFLGRGCAISQAAASMLTEMIKGHDLSEVAELGQQDLMEELGIPLSPVRQKCALLSLKVLKSSIASIEYWSLADGKKNRGTEEKG